MNTSDKRSPLRLNNSIISGADTVADDRPAVGS